MKIFNQTNLKQTTLLQHSQMPIIILKSMKQKQNPSNLEKTFYHPNPYSFKQTIQKIELTALKTTQQKKKIALLKNRLKQQWLDRVKIIPPRINPTDRDNLFRATDSFADQSSIKNSKHLCYKRDSLTHPDQLFQKRPCQLELSADQIARKQQIERKSYEASSAGFQRYKKDQLRQRKFKENWKHSYRKDEMNALRFSATTPMQVKFSKPTDPNKPLYTIIPVDDCPKNEPDTIKVSTHSKRSFNLLENKENVEIKEEDKKEEKKYRFNVKKNKTSLLVKKTLLP